MHVNGRNEASTRLFEAFRRLPTSTVSTVLEDMGIDGIVQNIKPIASGFRFAGAAVTVKEVTGAFGTYAREDFKLSEVLDAAGEGDVVVIDNAGHQVSTWGGMASLAAQRRGVAGLLVDGGVRDWNEINEIGFPVFSRHVVCTSARTRIKIESINAPIRIDNICVNPRDVIIGDGTGVVVVPIDVAEEVLRLSLKHDEEDRRARTIIESGGSFAEALRGMLRRQVDDR